MTRIPDPERSSTEHEPEPRAAGDPGAAPVEADRSKSEASKRIDELRGDHVHQRSGRRSAADEDVTASVARALERIADSLATIASTLARSQGPRPRPAQEFRRWPRGDQRGGYGEPPRHDDREWPRRGGPRGGPRRSR